MPKRADSASVLKRRLILTQPIFDITFLSALRRGNWRLSMGCAARSPAAVGCLTSLKHLVAQYLEGKDAANSFFLFAVQTVIC